MEESLSVLDGTLSPNTQNYITLTFCFSAVPEQTKGDMPYKLSFMCMYVLL